MPCFLLKFNILIRENSQQLYLHYKNMLHIYFTKLNDKCYGNSIHHVQILCLHQSKHIVLGNYYPVTESAYIEDDKTRLTLLVDHASGVSSLQEGWLEVMVDKRTMHDDARGMGEGVMDSRLTRHR